MTEDYSAVSERVGQAATWGQIADMRHRYQWAAEQCHRRRVLEVACGTAQGFGLLSATAASVVGCDVDESAVRVARRIHGEQAVTPGRAEALPWPAVSGDAIVLLEALYYVPDVVGFLRECRRVLAPGGIVLISVTNKDLFDFAPSPLSREYFGAADLPALFEQNGFRCELFGYGRVTALPLRHRVLRPFKTVARSLHLLPETMQAKARVRRIVFGKLSAIPEDLSTMAMPYEPPDVIQRGAADRTHRFIYALGRLVDSMTRNGAL